MSDRTAEEQTGAVALYASIPKTNVLTYSLVRQVLGGTVGGRRFGPYRAQSGAGQRGISTETVSFRDWRPAKQKSGDGAGERGGVIMPGWWAVVPERLDKGGRSSLVSWGGAPTNASLRLLPYKLASGFTASLRHSFYIHGTGGRGSDGCILLGPAEREQLVQLVLQHGGAWLRAVLDGRELNDAMEASDRFNRTA